MRTGSRVVHRELPGSTPGRRAAPRTPGRSSSTRSATGPLRPQRRVVEVPALGDDEAEVQRGRRRPGRRRRPAPRPTRRRRARSSATCTATSGTAAPAGAVAVRRARARRGARRAAAAAVGRPVARRRASATSWPCAHVSMIRAVSADAALISGPYHGHAQRRVERRGTSRRSRRAARANHAEQLAPARSRCSPRPRSVRRPTSACSAREQRLGTGGDPWPRARRPRRSTRGGSPGRRPTSPAPAWAAATARRSSATRSRCSTADSRREVVEQGVHRRPARQRPFHRGGRSLAERTRPFLRVLAAVHRLPDRVGRSRTRRRGGPTAARYDHLASPRAPTAARWPRSSPPAPAPRRAARRPGTTRLTSPTSYARGGVDRVAGEQELAARRAAAPATAAAPPTARPARPSPR